MEAPKPKLLIVDDIADNRTILTRRFERQGFHILEADGGLAALELIARESFDVVLLDIVMPDLDGIEVLKRLRTTYSPSQLPVIMVTARAENKDIVEALGFGANDYVTKPVDFAIALARVQTQIARKQAEDGLERKIRELEDAKRQLELEIVQHGESQARLQHMAKHDALTGLGNRVLLQEKLRRALSRLERQQGNVSLVVIDLADFKCVNEAFGFEAGDDILVGVTERLSGCLAHTDTLVRLGADEFAVLSVDVNGPESASHLVDRISHAVALPHDLPGQQIVLSCSIGVAMAPSDGNDPDTLLRSAEMALRGAKADGGGLCRFFEPGMNARAQARRLLEGDLKNALAAGQFEVFYQPLFNLARGEISGFEALLRWKHPNRGMISPAEFIPLAEESGLIVALGEWVLREACREAAHWPAPLRIAVNISGVEFQSGNVANAVISALAASALPANRLELEITETILLKDDERTLNALHQLRSLGVRVSMDDFGTGYSSLSYLRSFPFDKIKIDQSFIRNLTFENESLAIVRAVVSMAQSLNMITIAEGVETQEQLDLLRAEGCHEVQGYLISAPMPVRDLALLLRQSEPLRRSA